MSSFEQFLYFYILKNGILSASEIIKNNQKYIFHNLDASNFMGKLFFFGFLKIFFENSFPPAKQ
jgi:hypothetical protein